jgi:hypothetical protein
MEIRVSTFTNDSNRYAQALIEPERGDTKSRERAKKPNKQTNNLPKTSEFIVS